MNIIQRAEHWGDTHHPKWIDVIRMLLGAFILLKAAQFIGSMNQLSHVMDNYQSNFIADFSLGATRYYTIMTSIVCGFLIGFGCLTRIACILQIPVFLCALIFFHSPTGLMAPDKYLGLILLVLLLLVFFAIEGGGPWSADRLLKSHPEKGH